MNLVEAAAWIICTKTTYDAVCNVVFAKQRRIEMLAAKAEYEDCYRKLHEIDEGKPVWEQNRTKECYRERQRQLLIRYLEVLIDAADSRYYKEARSQDAAENPPIQERLKENWKWWLVLAMLYVLFYFISNAVKTWWAIHGVNV